MTSWHSYPSIYALGHKAVADIFVEPVLIEEQIDGSQFSFGIFETNRDMPNTELAGYTLRCRSKRAEILPLAPDKMFQAAV